MMTNDLTRRYFIQNAVLSGAFVGLSNRLEHFEKGIDAER
jgi:hypothetical protein